MSHFQILLVVMSLMSVAMTALKGFYGPWLLSATTLLRYGKLLWLSGRVVRK
jgi:hypothetical protein